MGKNFEVVDLDETIEFTLRLDDLHDLFTAPELDPFVDELRVTSGVEDMVAYLFTRRLRKLPKVRVALVLPQAAPDSAAEAKAAMQRYCDVQITSSRRAMAINTFDGRAKLPVGLLAASAMIVAVFLFFMLLPENLQPLTVILAPIVTIASWAAIWNPVETLLYENWEERRTVQAYTCLREMEIGIAAAGSAEVDTGLRKDVKAPA